MTLWHLRLIIITHVTYISRKCEHAASFLRFSTLMNTIVFSCFCSVICRNSKCSNSVFSPGYFIQSSICAFSYLCFCNWRWSESITLRLLALMVNNIVFQIIYAKLNIAPLEACMRYGLNGSNPLWRLYWLLGSAIFSWQRNSTHSLICAGGWLLFVQLEKHKLNLECLMCVAYNAHHITRLEFRLCF